MTMRIEMQRNAVTIAWTLVVFVAVTAAPPKAQALATLVVDNSCDSNQAGQIENAFHEAADVAHGALSVYFSRSTSTTALRWFNVSDFESVHVVINTLQATDNRFQAGGTITVSCRCQSNSDIALTNSNGFAACPNFFNLPATGLESQAGVFFHEVTHFAAGTVDCTNLWPPAAPISEKEGPDMALDLAEQHPDKAIRNAISYEYYAEEVMYGFDMSEITRFDMDWPLEC